MAEEKKNKGKLNNYNEIPVKQKDYYYDVTDSGEPGKPSGTGTDKEIKKDFGDMFFGLKQVRLKIKEKVNKDDKLEIKKEK